MPAKAVAAMDELLADPDKLDELVSDLIDLIPRHVPSYRQIPIESLRSGNRQIVVTALSHLREGRVPQAAELRELNAIGRLRAEEGIDLASMLAAYQVAGREFWTIFSRQLDQLGVGPGELLSVATLIWQWLDAVTLAVATARHEIGLQSVREDERRVSDALRGLLLQPESPTVCAQQLLSLGLDPEGEYVAFRGRPAEGVTAGTLREALADAASSADGDAVTAVIQHDVIGVADPLVLVDLLPTGLGVLGTGPALPAGLLHQSYLTASRALTASMRLGRTGLNRLEDLRLAGVAATDPEIADVLSDRILRPLLVKRRYADEIWRSVVSYLEHGQHVDDTARALHVHSNTLRHRLAVFAELTEIDLRRPADMAEVWWLVAIGAAPATATSHKTPMTRSSGHPGSPVRANQRGLRVDDHWAGGGDSLGARNV